MTGTSLSTHSLMLEDKTCGENWRQYMNRYKNAHKYIAVRPFEV
jgi:hypothetical protein